MQILPGQWTIGDVLTVHGYHTGIVGKLHLGGELYRLNSNSFASRTDPDDVVDFSRRFVDGPTEHGFDFSYVLLRGIQASPYAFFRNDRLDGGAGSLVIWEEGWYGGSNIPTTGIGVPDWNTKTVGPKLAQEAIDFIDQHHQANLDNDTETPFFLYYASQSAHGPYTPPDTFLGEPVSGVTGMFNHADMVYEIDVALGKLIEALEQRGLDDDTLIIFTSDNGGIPHTVELNNGHDSAGGLRGWKGADLGGRTPRPFHRQMGRWYRGWFIDRAGRRARSDDWSSRHDGYRSGRRRGAAACGTGDG